MIYPIICIKPGDKFIYGYARRQQFEIADNELVDEGVFSGVVIIDSMGHQFAIRSVKKTGWANRLGGYGLFLKGRRVKLEFQLEALEDLTVEETRVLIFDRLQGNDFPESEEIKTRIAQASDFPALYKPFI